MSKKSSDDEDRKSSGWRRINDETATAPSVGGDLKPWGMHPHHFIGRRVHSGSSTDVGQVNRSVSIAAAEKAARLFAGFIKDDSAELRGSWIFNETYRQIQWQRDSYFIGTEYANWSKRRRQREGEDKNARSVEAYLTLMPCGDSLASQQLTKIAADFMPEPTVKTALLPMIVKVSHGALYRPIKNALINVIYSQQRALDRLFKRSLLNFLDSPSNRQNIKNSTKGYISRYE